MSKHTKTDLLQMQSLPLHLKIRMSQRRIKDWYEYYGGDVYISFSGGKDSTVLKHLVENTICDDITSLFINTGLEYPEIQKFAMSQPNVLTVTPNMRFNEVITKYGYPIISKEVSNNIEGARNSINKGVNSYRLMKMRGEVKDKNGNKSAYNTDKYKYLLDAPFKISDKCCDIMKKDQHISLKKWHTKSIYRNYSSREQIKTVGMV